MRRIRIVCCSSWDAAHGAVARTAGLTAGSAYRVPAAPDPCGTHQGTLPGRTVYPWISLWAWALPSGWSFSLQGTRGAPRAPCRLASVRPGIAHWACPSHARQSRESRSCFCFGCNMQRSVSLAPCGFCPYRQLGYAGLPSSYARVWICQLTADGNFKFGFWARLVRAKGLEP